MFNSVRIRILPEFASIYPDLPADSWLDATAPSEIPGALFAVTPPPALPKRVHRVETAHAEVIPS